MTEAHENLTPAGEPTIRRGKVVPEDAVNIAYVRAPRLSPEDNVVIVDTSRLVEENAVDFAGRRRLYYANSLGILEDASGNQLVDEEFPYVTDVFRVDEDFSTVAGSEYEDEDVLPFVHVSRHFHLDVAGLVLSGDLFEFREDMIKVIDSRGRIYLAADGKPRYKVRIAPAVSANMVTSTDQTPYRVYAYIDSMDEEELYLVYNKVELDASTGLTKNQRLNYKELLNPRPVFEYLPEEAEVVDQPSWNLKVYSTKPISLKTEILGLPHAPVDGYRVYVPRKAKGDPRVFQLFHWRLACDFIQAYQVDQARQGSIIRVGVIVTNSQPRSKATFAFYNLGRTGRNALGIVYVNPLSPTWNKESAAYWEVNFDTISDTDLAKFDMLIWAPVTDDFNFTNYTGKIDTFTRNMGGTLFIDTSSTTVPSGLGVTTTPAVNFAGYGATGLSGVRASGADPTVGDPLINANGINENNLGGWNLLDGQNNDEIRSLSIRQWANAGSGPPGYTQYFTGYPGDFTPVLRMNGQPVTIRKKVGFGHLIISTFGHLYTCSAYINSVPDLNSGAVQVLHYNYGPDVRTIAQVSDWSVLLHSVYVEGALKLLSNAALLAASGRSLADRDPESYASKWSHASEWRSSWVIDGSALSEAEQRRHNFVSSPEDPFVTPAVMTMRMKRRLSERTCDEIMNALLAAAGPQAQQRAQGSARIYRLELTNATAVKTESVFNENGGQVAGQGGMRLHAWTTAYTPKFVVPPELGPHVVREEEQKGEWAAGEYRHVSYPAKTYAGRVRAAYVTSAEELASKHVTWTATGTALHTWTDYIDHPPETFHSESEIELSWASRGKGGSQKFPSQLGVRFGYMDPDGISTWGEDNYNKDSINGWAVNFPYVGFTQRYQSGSSGEVVKFIQEALNAFHRSGFFNSSRGYLAIDGGFGAATAQVIRDLQTARNARYIDGIVDAETWSIIGYQIIRGGYHNWGRGGHFQFFDYPYTSLPVEHISDLNNSTTYAKRSWFSNGPATIWDYLEVTFDQAYNIHAITVIPYLEGQTQNMIVRSMHVTNERSLTGYTGEGAHLTGLWRPRNGEEFTLGFAPRSGNSIIVGIGQDGPAGPGWGTSRFMGVRDIRARANVLTSHTKPGWREEISRSQTITFQDSGSLDITVYRDEVRRAVPPQPQGGYLSAPHWHALQVVGPGVSATMDTGGLIFFKSLAVITSAGSSYTDGPKIPGGVFYSTDVNGRPPTRETGLVSAVDGIKLLCDANGLPYGFPPMPTNIGANEFQRHYASLALSDAGNDSNVMIGFYDKHPTRREFITDNGEKDGNAVMSYGEWTARGQHNVYIAVMTSYQAPSVMRQIPEDNDAPRLPYRWAMPVYGIYRRAGARITLEPLPKNLGLTDVWPIAVRDGRFSRLVTIQVRAQGYLTTWAKNYQGSTVRAYYSLPESGGWSTLHGPPFADVVGEEPLILDDDVIQVRQEPILMVTEPTPYAGYADPVRPALKLWRRASFDSAWVAQPWTEIRDYNASTGEIFLTTKLTVDDPGLLKVDYTSERRHYYFKRSESTLLNLNPWSAWSRAHLGEAIYVYLVPRYAVKDTGEVITDSVTDEPLRFSTSPNIFDPMRPEHDPLAVLLGIIYVSAALDIADLTVLDTRRRGGGAREGLAAVEVARLVAEAITYWDVGYAAGPSYQKGGFVVVRLPVELKDSFTEAEIAAVVERNLTVGVRFKLEDLSGNEWS